MERVATVVPVELEKSAETQSSNPNIDNADIRSLQAYYEGNRVYVVTYYMDDRIMIKMYEKSGGSNSMYHYLGMIEQSA